MAAHKRTRERVVSKTTPARASVWVIVTSTLLHLLVAGRVGLGVDEAHYALYGLHPDWSYFDHPPMIGWLQGLILPVSQGEFALRLIPILLFAVTSWILYRLTLEFFPEETRWLGFVSVLLFQAGIVFHLVGLSMLPESPLLPIALLAIFFLKRAVQDGRTWHWLVVGLCYGLAGLSKYTAITLIVTAILYVLLSRPRHVLTRPGPWLAAALALICITPVLYWNAKHNWISFVYQLHHGLGGRGWSLKLFLLSQLAQMVSYTPAIFVFGIIAAVAARHEWRKEEGVRLCLLLSLPILLLFGWGGGYEFTLPHWTALAWAGMIPLTARYLVRHYQDRGLKSLTTVFGFYSIVLIIFIHSMAVYPWLSFPREKHPLRDLYGWEKAAQRAEILLSRMAATPGTEPELMVNNWSLASRLAWYARPHPVKVIDTRYDQFDIWFGSLQPGARGIIVVPSYSRQPKMENSSPFSRCDRIDELPVEEGGQIVFSFFFYACYDFQG